MGDKGKRRWRWTKEEEAVLVAYYPLGGSSRVISELAKLGCMRTVSQVRQKVYTTRFGRKHIMRIDKRWSPDEYAVLLKHFDENSTILQTIHGLKRSALAIRMMKYRIRRRDKL